MRFFNAPLRKNTEEALRQAQEALALVPDNVGLREQVGKLAAELEWTKLTNKHSESNPVTEQVKPCYSMLTFETGDG